MAVARLQIPMKNVMASVFWLSFALCAFSLAGRMVQYDTAKLFLFLLSCQLTWCAWQSLFIPFNWAFVLTMLMPSIAVYAVIIGRSLYRQL